MRFDRNTIFFGAFGLLVVILTAALSVAVYNGTPPENKAPPGYIAETDGMPALRASGPGTGLASGKDPIIGKWIAPTVGFTLTFDDTYCTVDFGNGYPITARYYKKEVYVFTGNPPDWTLTTVYTTGDDQLVWMVVGDRLYDCELATNCYVSTGSYIPRAG